MQNRKKEHTYVYNPHIEKRKETVFIWILVVFRISFCSLKDKDEDFSGHQTFWPLVGTPQAIVTISGLRASPCLVINGMFLFSMKCKNSITFLSYYFIVRIWQIIQLYFVMKSTLHLHKIIKMWRAFIKRLIGFGALESVKNNLIWIDHHYECWSEFRNQYLLSLHGRIAAIADIDVDKILSR